MDMRLDGERVVAEFAAEKRHEGWPGIVHGGIIHALLYEVSENWAYLNGIVTMMRGMSSRLVSPAKVGETILATSWLDQRDGREMTVHSRLEVDGRAVAEGNASLVELSEGQRQRLGM